MGLVVVLFWRLLIGSTGRLTQSSRREPVRRHPERRVEGRADEVIAGRLARGEIDAEEFARLRDLLRVEPRGGAAAGQR